MYVIARHPEWYDLAYMAAMMPRGSEIKVCPPGLESNVKPGSCGRIIRQEEKARGRTRIVFRVRWINGSSFFERTIGYASEDYTKLEAMAAKWEGKRPEAVKVAPHKKKRRPPPFIVSDNGLEADEETLDHLLSVMSKWNK